MSRLNGLKDGMDVEPCVLDVHSELGSDYLHATNAQAKSVDSAANSITIDMTPTKTPVAYIPKYGLVRSFALVSTRSGFSREWGY